jgi:hypothetical protein
MPSYDFPVNVMREVRVGLAQHLGIDKPSSGPPEKNNEEDWRKIVRIKLKHRDERGHEQEVAEWEERDLYGKGISLETIVRGIELAACRDAAFQPAAEVIYALIFDAKDHPNRSRFFFKLPGGQEVQHLALTPHGGGFGRPGQDGSPFAERIMPDILKYVSEKEDRLEKRATHLWDTLMKSNQHFAGVVTEYTDREAKLRQIELNAEDHDYERKKQRKEEEQNAKMKEEIWQLLKEEGPKALPFVLGALQRFSQGPNAEYEPGFIEWYQERERQKREAESRGGNGHGGEGNGRNGNGGGRVKAWKPKVSSSPPGKESGDAPNKSSVEDAEVEEQGTAGTTGSGGDGSDQRAADTESRTDGVEARGEVSDLDQLRLRVSFDTCRFVMLLRGRGKLEVVRKALTPAQLPIFDGIVDTCDSGDVESDEAVERIAEMALVFGAAVRAEPVAGMKLLGALDGMCKLALVDLSKLLEQYHDELRRRGGA